MPKTSLSVMLENNFSKLGENCTNLGKTVSWFGKKVYISYERVNGWSVVELNIFQRLLRYIFGMYASTHLETVARSLDKARLKGQVSSDSPVFTRIQKLWHYAYPRKPIPHATVVLGNVKDVKDAEVICLGDVHANTAARKMIGEYIERYYRKGDIILMEGIPVGKKEFTEKYGMTSDVLEGLPVEGWEPQDIDGFHSELFKVTNEKHKALKVYKESLLASVPDNIQNPQDLNALSQKIVSSKSELDALVRYFIKKPHDQEKFIKKLYSLFVDDNNELFNMLSRCHGERKNIVRYLILKILSQLESSLEKATYRNMSSEENLKAWENFDERNHSLCGQIKKYHARGRRVFVLCGMAHVIPFRGHPIQEVKETLNNYPHAIVALNEELRKGNFLVN